MKQRQIDMTNDLPGSQRYREERGIR